MTGPAARGPMGSIALASTAVLFSGVSAAGAPAWELTEERDGIQVFTRPIPGQDFREFMGVGIVEAPIEVLYHQLLDIQGYPRWFASCQQATLLEQVDASTRILWYVQDAPWPVSDRDVVLRAVTRVDWRAGRVEVQLTSVDDARRPPGAQRVRMRSMSGAFVLEYKGRERTRVTYTIRADPSGSVPAVLASASSRNQPLGTLQGMRRMATQDSYRAAAAAAGDTQAVDAQVAAGVLGH